MYTQPLLLHKYIDETLSLTNNVSSEICQVSRELLTCGQTKLLYAKDVSTGNQVMGIDHFVN